MNENVSEEELIHYRAILEQSAGLIKIVEKDNFLNLYRILKERMFRFNNLENIKVVESWCIKRKL